MFERAWLSLYWERGILEVDNRMSRNKRGENVRGWGRRERQREMRKRRERGFIGWRGNMTPLCRV